ncbi:putative zinc finger protein GLI2 [Amylocarpus encephaloides]|uniref:Zinc finger protein GLI2 n=1 Tax=Amylocarpus encephaloides TaxID=45428 RepID=A0A9P7YKI7_9HELO|nr:putative zinc finger protein GLI2 [Amylocarpus encephaloides]
MHQHEQEHDENNIPHNQYPSPGTALPDHPYNQPGLDATGGISMVGMPELQPPKEESDPPSPGRSRAIAKPDREVTKAEDGKFLCTWPGCTEDTKTFSRKCEWSKHMDKHDRPYKCPAEGCEKLPGFTYSGGLLRHQREVHNLHGGPRKQLNCPHPNCKRHSGKGFSRQENLNEHLRRVHTPGDENAGDETEDDGSERAGMKRKRSGRQDDGEIRIELSRLRVENEDLRRASEAQTLQVTQLMRQLANLENIVTAGRMDHGGAPQAMM